MTTQPPQPDPEDRVDALRGGIPRWALIVLGIAGAFILFFLIRPLIFPSYFIPSQAMAPTIVEGDRVLARTFATSPDPGSVVVFESDGLARAGGADLLKRVIAIGGQTIEFRDGQVFVDGSEVYEPYLAEANSTRTRAIEIPGCVGPAAADRCVVPEGSVFVMGDNRAGSADSRTFGPVPTDAIKAKVFMKIMPFGRIGGL